MKAATPDYISVNDYLDTLNDSMSGLSGRIVGEITGLQMYEGRNYLFFSIKDKDTNAVLKCFMWKRAYTLSGVDLTDGLEVVISGFPQVFKPSGSLTFQTQSVELVGEGALKKAYDKLMAQLQKEGIFSPARKKPLPEFPVHIGLITSKDGAAIGDFLTNLGKFGFKISMIDSRVEGQTATQELLDSILTFKKKKIDVLVIIRGGGSLESFLPFNNELLIREIAQYAVPVLVGIGHERDVPLLGLAADRMVSTPTAAALALNESWQKASAKVDINRERLFSLFDRLVRERRVAVDRSFNFMKQRLEAIFTTFDASEQGLRRSLTSMRSRIGELQRSLAEYPKGLQQRMKMLITTADRHLTAALTPAMKRMKSLLNTIDSNLTFQEKILHTHDPTNILKLGYAITYVKGKIVKGISEISEGEVVSVRVKDGSFDSKVITIAK